MGVSNFKKLIDFLHQSKKYCWEEVEIGNEDVIIDGNALYYFLYFKSDPKLDERCGGDYPGFKDEVCKFFDTLEDCNVNPYVIMDGASEPDKQAAAVSRLGNKLEKAKRIAGGTLQEGDNVLPPLVKDVFIELLREKGIRFKVCLGEADPEVVSEANQKKCAVLSHDTDFYIYQLTRGFLHLDNFLWKNKKDGKIPAKLYSCSKFCEHFKLDPTLMPVFASLAGNDYFKFKYKIEDIPVHKNEIKETIGYGIKLLDRMLCNLSGVDLTCSTDSEKIPRALDHLKELNFFQKFSEEDNQRFKTSIEKYDRRETQNTSPNLPSWVCKKVEEGKLTSFVISVADQKTMMLTPLVEDFSQQSSYTTASCIRQYFYGLLTGGEITEYDRVEEIKCRGVQPTLLISDEQYLDQVSENLRHSVFKQALKVQTLDLNNIQNELKLPVCVTYFWLKTLHHHTKPEIVNCLHALLLWFVRDPDVPAHQPEQEERRSVEDEFERRMKALKDEGVYKWQPRVAHAFSQWQCCMRQSLHLNQLLCSPLPEPQCARLYCGPLLHRLADKDKIKQLEETLDGQKKELYEYLKTILNPESISEESSSEEELPTTAED